MIQRPRRHDYWSLDNTIKELRLFCQRNKKLVKTCFASSLLVRHAPQLYKSAQKHGGIRKLNSDYNLGMKLKARYLSESQIRKELKKVRLAGHPLTQSSLVALRRFDILNSIRLFGTLSSFKQKLGLPFKKHTRWTKESILHTYKSLYVKWGVIPTNNLLIENGHGGLPAAIRNYFGSYQALRKQLNIPARRNADHYWTEENTIKELKKFCRKHKELIKATSVYGALERQKRQDLRTAVGIWGGLRKMNSRFDLGMKLQGDTPSEEQLLKELGKLQRAGHLITQKGLLKIGRSDLLTDMAKYGSMNAFKSKLGLPVKRHRFWSEERIMEMMRPIVDQLGFMPGLSMLAAMGKGDLGRAISKKGGFRKFAGRLGTILSQYYIAIDGHWMNSAYECIFDNILFKHNIRHAVHVDLFKGYKYQCDFLIGDTYIEIVGFDRKGHPQYFLNLDKKIALYRQHGYDYLVFEKQVFTKNMINVEQRILAMLGDLALCTDKRRSSAVNVATDIRPSVYWVGLENIKKELQPLISKYGGRMPLDAELRKEKKSGLIGAIYRYHGSFFELGKKMNVPVLNKPKGLYSGDKALATYKEACLSQGRYLTYKDLLKEGLYGLITEISKKQGGIFKFRQKCSLNSPQTRTEYRAWPIEKVVQEYRELCERKRRFLTKKELLAMGAAPLVNAIGRNRGIYKIRERTGLNLPHKVLPPGYYTTDSAVDRYRMLCLEMGYFLTKRELSAHFPPTLLGFITGNIGLGKMRKLTKLKYKVNKMTRKKTYSVEKAVSDYKRLCLERNYFLIRKELIAAGEDGLAQLILTRIGYREIRKLTSLTISLNKEPKRTAAAERKEKAVKEYTALCRKKRKFLHEMELTAMGFSYLAGVILRNGGFADFKNLSGLDYPSGKIRDEYSKEQTVTAYRKLCREKGYFLTPASLARQGWAKLATAIKYWGGFAGICEMTGLTLPVHRADDSYTVRQAVREFRRLSSSNGAFFSKNDFIAIGKIKLAWFIQNNGGYREFQRLSGLNIRKMHKKNQKNEY
ncbi:MAG TPA: hypothetical protein VNS58_01070 [Puia sp.]|nr:hypothetical protein [Puia sp.]